MEIRALRLCNRWMTRLMIYTTSKGAIWPPVLSLRPAPMPAAPYNDLVEWIKRTTPAMCKVNPAEQHTEQDTRLNHHNFHQLITLLRNQNTVRIRLRARNLSYI